MRSILTVCTFLLAVAAVATPPPQCPSVPIYYPDAGGCHNRDVAGEAGPRSCLRYRHGDTEWIREIGGEKQYCVTSILEPQYVEFGVPYRLVGGGLIDPHDERTARSEHVSPHNRMMRTFGREVLAAAVSPPMLDFDVVVAVTGDGERYVSLYVKCGSPHPWKSTNLVTGVVTSGESSTCIAEWIYLPSLMGDVVRYEPAKVKGK